MEQRLDETVLSRLNPRKEDSNKASFGTLSVFCGCEQMPGAAYLSISGALRSGVGLVRAAASGALLSVLQNKLAEPVWVSPSSLPDTKANAFLCGCGLGRSNDAFLEQLLPKIEVPAVYDADCINFLALHTDMLNRLQSDRIFTPHPMEFSRLSKIPLDAVLRDRVQLARSFALTHRCVLVLKGHETVIASPTGEVCINPTGGSGLAKGGSGDVLAGVIASLLAQGHSPFDAACIGVYVHGKAGDELTKRYGAHGMLPSDLPKEIGRLLG